MAKPLRLVRVHPLHPAVAVSTAYLLDCHLTSQHIWLWVLVRMHMRTAVYRLTAGSDSTRTCVPGL